MISLSLQPLSAESQITIGMASIPDRMKGMIRTLTTLLPSCDNFDLYLNDYPLGFSLPILEDPKVNVFRSPPDLGARGKLYMAHRTPGYYLTVDDDLVYPPNYVYNIVQGIEKYKRQAVVGYHGVLFAQRPDPMNPPTRHLFSHQGMLERDMPVHMLGTGLMGYHSDTLMFGWREMQPGKIDEQVAWRAQDTRTPLIVLAHPSRWVVEDDSLKYRGALRRNVQASEEAMARIAAREWHLYLPDCWKEYQEFP